MGSAGTFLSKQTSNISFLELKINIEEPKVGISTFICKSHFALELLWSQDTLCTRDDKFCLNLTNPSRPAPMELHLLFS